MRRSGCAAVDVPQVSPTLDVPQLDVPQLPQLV
jgi:hypothetical protein